MAEQVQETDCVLVIDGDVLVRHAIADYLRGCGYTVIEASSTDEAVTVLDDSALDVDAVLCDAEAPGSRNAFQFRSWAIEHRQNVDFALAGNIESAAQKAAELCRAGPAPCPTLRPPKRRRDIRRLLGRAQLDGCRRSVAEVPRSEAAASPQATRGLRRLDHLDRHSELLELRPELCGIADDDPGKALRIEDATRGLIEARGGLRAIFGGQRLVIIVGPPEHIDAHHCAQHRAGGFEVPRQPVDLVAIVRDSSSWLTPFVVRKSLICLFISAIESPVRSACTGADTT